MAVSGIMRLGRGLLIYKFTVRRLTMLNPCSLFKFESSKPLRWRIKKFSIELRPVGLANESGAEAGFVGSPRASDPAAKD